MNFEITFNTYAEDELLESEINIIVQVAALVPEELYESGDGRIVAPCAKIKKLL